MESPASFLSRNAVEVSPEGALEERLAEGRPLRVKLGLDPTAPDLHLGHTVVLQKLREFQDLGHTVVLIIGDYTARVGDPSGRSATRPVLSFDEIDEHAQTYLDQATKVLADDERLEVRRNSEWLDMTMEDLFRLVRTVTIARLLERDDFAKRMAAAEPISLLEFLYPVLQGYDSVADPRRRRDGRHRPDVQSAHGPRAPVHARPEAADRADDAAAERARRDAYVVHSHLSRDVPQDHVPVFQLDAERGVRKHLDHFPLHLNRVFFRHHRVGSPPLKLAFLSRLSYCCDIMYACTCVMKSIVTTTMISRDVPPK